MKLPKLRLYKMQFLGPSYGLYLSYYQGRIIVRKKHPKREEQYGADVKPDVGSIVLALNGYSLPQKMNFQLVLNLMKDLIQKNPVELTIGEDKEFSTFFSEVVLPTLEEQTPREEKATNKHPANGGNVMNRAANGETVTNFHFNQQRMNITEKANIANFSGPTPPRRSTYGNGSLSSPSGIGSEHNAIELLDDD
mmetsp:Transcript_827/g.1176  ORF Transcript_827/g.1176 Transcript_827/m.1176 type:complete len:194 (-) Transcript_827:31-612(-)